VVPSEVNEILNALEHCTALRSAGDSDSSSTAELKKAFVSQEAEGSQHRIGVDAEDCGQVPRWGHALAGGCFSFSDGAPNLCGHLFVESQRVGAINLDV
jgi:hypothetical protein